MTKRKPPNKSWESWTEEQIRQAQDAGQFDDLAGAGRPIPDITGTHDPQWWLKKLMQREQVSLLPKALEIRQQVERELEQIWHLAHEDDVRARVAALNADIGRVNRTTISGPATSLALLDVEEIVKRWREKK